MKLLRFGLKGQEKPGILDADGAIRDLSSIVKDINGQVLEHELDKIRNTDLTSLPIVDAETRLGACVTNIGKFICIGLNYSDHAEETGTTPPVEPVVFSKWTSAVVGPNDNVEIPKNSLKTDWEVELGVVIGKSGRYISKEDAMSHVAGYCVINDVSERAFQLEGTGTWDKGKGCDTFGPTGPWLVTKDEIKDQQNLRIWLEVDGHRYQDGNTANMIFDVPTIVSYLSQYMSLQAGDVISTGTPAGVGLGQTPPVFLKEGQVIKLGIEGLGEQQQTVVSA